LQPFRRLTIGCRPYFREYLLRQAEEAGVVWDAVLLAVSELVSQAGLWVVASEFVSQVDLSRVDSWVSALPEDLSQVGLSQVDSWVFASGLVFALLSALALARR
jgi:hypothetical protein